MREDATSGSEGTPARSGPRSWMLYGAVGHTGALIAQHATSAVTGPCSQAGARQPSPHWPGASSRRGHGTQVALA